MKVVKLKRGYSIRLSDSEFGVLSTFVSEAEAGEVEDALIQYLEPAEKAAWHKRTIDGEPFLRTDEVRR